MIFNTKFGLGEIVIYQPCKNGVHICSEVLEVTGIYINRDNNYEYLCRYPLTGVTVNFTECQLEGDPDFDQIAGKYQEGEE